MSRFPVYPARLRKQLRPRAVASSPAFPGHNCRLHLADRWRKSLSLAKDGVFQLDLMLRGCFG